MDVLDAAFAQGLITVPAEQACGRPFANVPFRIIVILVPRDVVVRAHYILAS